MIQGEPRNDVFYIVKYACNFHGVVDDILMCNHHAFRISGRTGRVLQEGNFIEFARIMVK